jgi:hypothetical protein
MPAATSTVQTVCADTGVAAAASPAATCSIERSRAQLQHAVTQPVGLARRPRLRLGGAEVLRAAGPQLAGHPMHAGGECRTAPRDLAPAASPSTKYAPLKYARIAS